MAVGVVEDLLYGNVMQSYGRYSTNAMPCTLTMFLNAIGRYRYSPCQTLITRSGYIQLQHYVCFTSVVRHFALANVTKMLSFFFGDRN